MDQKEPRGIEIQRLRRALRAMPCDVSPRYDLRSSLYNSLAAATPIHLAPGAAPYMQHHPQRQPREAIHANGELSSGLQTERESAATRLIESPLYRFRKAIISSFSIITRKGISAHVRHNSVSMTGRVLGRNRPFGVALSPLRVPGQKEYQDGQTRSVCFDCIR